MSIKAIQFEGISFKLVVALIRHKQSSFCRYI